jgi:hypothetical protein
VRSRPSQLQNVRRRQPDNQSQAERNQHEIIKLANDRDKVWNKIDGTEGIRGDQHRQDPHKNGRPRIARGVIHREGLLFELFGLRLK